MSSAGGVYVNHTHNLVSSYAELFASPEFDPDWPRYDVAGRLTADSETEPAATIPSDRVYVLRAHRGFFGKYALSHPDARAAARTHADPRLLLRLVSARGTPAELRKAVVAEFPALQLYTAQPVGPKHVWAWRLMRTTDLLLGVALLFVGPDGCIFNAVVFLAGCGCDWNNLIRS